MTASSPIYPRVFVEHQDLPIDGGSQEKKGSFVLEEFRVLLKGKNVAIPHATRIYPYQRVGYLINAVETLSLPLGIKGEHEP